MNELKKKLAEQLEVIANLTQGGLPYSVTNAGVLWAERQRITQRLDEVLEEIREQDGLINVSRDLQETIQQIWQQDVRQDIAEEQDKHRRLSYYPIHS